MATNYERLTTGTMLPHFIERGRTQVLVLDLRELGGIVDVDSATVTILDESDTKIIDAAAATVTDEQITYSLAGSSTTSEDLSDRWRVEWSVLEAGESGTQAHTIVEEAHLCRNTLYPVIAEHHLRRRHSALTADLLPPEKSSYQGYVDDAWEDVQAMLLGEGKRPYLVLSAWSLKTLHLSMALARVFRDLATFSRGRGKYAEMADHYDEAAKAAWDGLTLDYDYDEDGALSSEDEEQASADNVVFLTGSVGSEWETDASEPL